MHRHKTSSIISVACFLDKRETFQILYNSSVPASSPPRYEFTVAMHLVYRALKEDMIPDQLPAELLPDKVPQPLSAPIHLPELQRNGGVGGGSVPRVSLDRPDTLVTSSSWDQFSSQFLRFVLREVSKLRVDCLISSTLV